MTISPFKAEGHEGKATVTEGALQLYKEISGQGKSVWECESRKIVNYEGIWKSKLANNPSL